MVGAGHENVAIGDLDICGIGLKEGGGHPLDLDRQRARRVGRNTAANDGRTAGIGAGSVRRQSRIALKDAHIVRFYTQFLGHDLGQRSFQALPV